MMLRLPVPGLRSRLLLLASGGLTLLWLSVEDNSVLPVTVLGTWLAGLLLVIWTGRQYGAQDLPLRLWLPGAGLLGVIGGAAATLMIVALMFFKTAWHSHLFPDYPSQMMLDMLAGLPLRALAGGCIGLAAGLLWLAVRRD